MNRKKAISHILLMILLIGMIPVGIQMATHNVAATGNTYTWYGNTSASASVAGNWAPATGPPGTGDNPIFDTNGNGHPACTLDNAVTYASLSMNAGTTVVVTLGANVGVSSFNIAAGTVTGSTSYTLTDSGGFTQTGGSLSQGVLILTMTGNGSTLSCSVSGNGFYNLNFNENTTVSSTIYAENSFVVASGKTVSIVSSKTIIVDGTCAVYTNSGTVGGAGNLQFLLKASDRTFTLGTISANLQIEAGPTASGSRIFTSGASCILSSTLLVLSQHASNTITFDLSAFSYALSATDLTIGARGILLGRASTITCSGSFDSSLGTYTPSTSTLICNGASKTIKTNQTSGTLNNLTIDTGGSYTLASDVVVGGNFVQTGSLALSTHYLNVTGTSTFNSNMAFSSGTYQPTGAVVCTGNWNTVGATYTTGTANVQMTGASTTVSTGSAQSIYNLDVSNVVSASTNLNVLNNLTVDTGQSLSIASGNTLTLSGGSVYLGPNANVVCAGNWDSANGSMISSSSYIYMTTANSFYKSNSAGAANYLIINSTGERLISSSGLLARILRVNAPGSVSLQQNSYVSGGIINLGTINQNGHILNVSGASATPITGYGYFDGAIYLNGSIASSYIITTLLPMGNLYADRDTTIELSATQTLRFVPSASEFVDVQVISYGSETGIAAKWYGTSTAPVTYSVMGNPNTLYDVWRDGTNRVTIVQADPTGLIQFTYNGPFSTHLFTVSVSGGPSVNLQASFSYTLQDNVLVLTDKSIGAVSTYLWNFGDGTGSTSQSPSHEYQKSGTYLISLTVYDSAGHSSTAKTTIKIVLGPGFPIDRGNGGWNIWVSDSLTISVSAIALLAVGLFLFLSSYVPSLPLIITPKGRKLIGIIILAFGIYWFVFIDNKWLSFDWLRWPW